MARVNVDQCALTDARFARLAQLRGWADADHARGKMLLIWNETIHRGPVLPVWLVEHHLGAGAAGDLLESQLVELVSVAGEVAGVPAGGTMVRIKGTEGRSDYLDKKIKAAKLGGKARAASAQRVAGRFVQPVAGEVAASVTSAPAPAPAPDTKGSEYMSGKPDPAAFLAQTAVGEINRLAGKNYKPETSLKLCRALVKAKRTPEQAVRVVQSKRAWIGDAKMGQFFRPATLLAAENFAKYLEDLEAGSSEEKTYRQDTDRPEATHPLMALFAEEDRSAAP